MKKFLKKAALYDPYLDILGGGEKHILSIIKVLEEEGYEINIFWDEDLTWKIKQKFSPQFINKVKWLPNVFKKRGNLIERFFVLRNLDLFFYVSDGSYFFSPAKKNFVFSMVPKRDLYPNSFLDRLKTLNFRFIANSRFTSSWLKKWGIENDYIYPYIEDKFLQLDLKKLKKEKIVLSVGRFFPHLHTKHHKIIISLFKKISRSHQNFKDFKLILAGGVKNEDREYFNQLKILTKDDPSIILKPNIDFDELYQLYKQSMFYWHFTGFGIDEEKHPEQVEHLGIASLEAMASGCIVFCYRAGGPKELIKDGKNGFLFSNEEELIKKMYSVVESSTLHRRIISNAQKYVSESFNYQAFKKKVKEVLFY